MVGALKPINLKSLRKRKLAGVVGIREAGVANGKGYQWLRITATTAEYLINTF